MMVTTAMMAFVRTMTAVTVLAVTAITRLL